MPHPLPKHLMVTEQSSWVPGGKGRSLDRPVTALFIVLESSSLTWTIKPVELFLRLEKEMVI